MVGFLIDGARLDELLFLERDFCMRLARKHFQVRSQQLSGPD
jgi:hypothetical protein